MLQEVSDVLYYLVIFLVYFLGTVRAAMTFPMTQEVLFELSAVSK